MKALNTGTVKHRDVHLTNSRRWDVVKSVSGSSSGNNLTDKNCRGYASRSGLCAFGVLSPKGEAGKKENED